MEAFGYCYSHSIVLNDARVIGLYGRAGCLCEFNSIMISIPCSSIAIRARATENEPRQTHSALPVDREGAPRAY